MPLIHNEAAVLLLNEFPANWNNELKIWLVSVYLLIKVVIAATGAVIAANKRRNQRRTLLQGRFSTDKTLITLTLRTTTTAAGVADKGYTSYTGPCGMLYTLGKWKLKTVMAFYQTHSVQVFNPRQFVLITKA